jgi:hypothetical protein
LKNFNEVSEVDRCNRARAYWFILRLLNDAVSAVDIT